MVLVIPKIIKSNRKRYKKLRRNFDRGHNKETAETSFYCFRLLGFLIKLLKGIFYYLLRIFWHILLNNSIIIWFRCNKRRFIRLWLVLIHLFFIGMRIIRYIWRIMMNNTIIKNGSATGLIAVVTIIFIINNVRIISNI